MKSLIFKFFSAFAKPAHIEVEDPIPLEEQYKAWKIVLSQRTLMKKMEEAKKIQPELIKESEEHLKKNSEIIAKKEWWEYMDSVSKRSVTWTVKE